MSPAPNPDELTAAERHMLSRILNEESSGTLMFELAYLVPVLVLVLLGLWHSSNAAFVSAFAIVVTFRVWLMRHDRASAPVLRSAVRKVCVQAGWGEDGTGIAKPDR